MNTKAENTPSETPVACADLEAIAARAYAIWQEQGCPEGRDMEHWIEAEAHYLNCREADAETQSDSAS